MKTLEQAIADYDVKSERLGKTNNGLRAAIKEGIISGDPAVAFRKYAEANKAKEEYDDALDALLETVRASR